MFEKLSSKFSGIFEKLTNKGSLTKSDIEKALKDVRLALLEADVSLEVTKDFIKSIEVKAFGQEITKSITPGQQVIKIVNDELIKVLTCDENLNGDLKIDSPPASILMVGLQGSGKTTSTVKIAKRLKEKNKKKVLIASLDTSRPAAMEQLEILGNQVNIDTLPIIKNQSPIEITQRTKQQALLGGYDVYILDSAGRLHIDEELMKEISFIKSETKTKETLLVVDGLTGQDAVNVAKEFDNNVGISGVVLTRMDGDGRGGAALSMKAVTGKPIKFVGIGEKLSDLEEFHPERIASRILGMGDIVSLVEKAQENVEADKAEKMIKRLQKGLFTMNDLKLQLEQMVKMGGVGGILGMMPGVKKMSKQIESSGMNDNSIRKQIALIQSMTKKERMYPNILQASRKKRVSKGAGLEVSDLNKLIKMHRQMADMMKKIGKSGNKGMLRGMIGQLFGKGNNIPFNENMMSQTPSTFGSQNNLELPSNLTNFGKKR